MNEGYLADRSTIFNAYSQWEKPSSLAWIVCKNKRLRRTPQRFLHVGAWSWVMTDGYPTNDEVFCEAAGEVATEGNSGNRSLSPPDPYVSADLDFLASVRDHLAKFI